MQLSYRKIWMTDAQWECCEFFADLFRGFHHVNGVFKDAGTTGSRSTRRTTISRPMTSTT